MKTKTNINDVVNELVSALRNDDDIIPDKWFSRRDVERAVNISTNQALRYISRFRNLKGFQEKKFKVNGRYVMFYNVPKIALKTFGKKPFRAFK